MKQFISVKKDNSIYYGGAQAWFNKTRNQKMGCGIIAAANVISALNAKVNKSYRITYEEFMEIAEDIASKYIFALPKLGVNGLFLMQGINRYFRKHRMPYRARWGTFRNRIWTEAERMLAEDIPVILSVGPMYPFIFRKKKLPLYVKNKTAYVCETYTSAHYVTITEIDGDYLKVSSWGKAYYIYKNDFFTYVNKQSNFWFSNILIIKI